ncbi:hypothetical protein GCM10027199_77390 [Amycolatopsis magusensis]
MAHQDMLSWESLTAERRRGPAERAGPLYRVPDGQFAMITPLRGSCRAEGVEWQGTTLIPGEVRWITASEPVRVGATPPFGSTFELAYVQLPTAILDEAAQPAVADSSQSTRFRSLKARDLHLATLLCALVRARETGASDQYAISAARYLGAYLLSPHIAENRRPGGLDPARLRAVIAHMKENLHDNITLDQLAKEAGVSRFHFLRRFSASVGETPLQHLTRIRVSAACHLLAIDDEPVSHVGRRCGFPRPENFTRVFRKWVGCAPSQYRDRIRRNPEHG